jgi:hypothetical protein
MSSASGGIASPQIEAEGYAQHEAIHIEAVRTCWARVCTIECKLAVPDMQ